MSWRSRRRGCGARTRSWRSGWSRSTRAACRKPPHLIFGDGDYEELVTRDTYLRAINEADAALARRVGEVRDEVSHEATLVAAARGKAVAYDERVGAAREEIAAVRETAAASAAHLAEISGAREASLSRTEGDIDTWVTT